LVLQEIVQKKKGEEREMADQSWQSKKTSYSFSFVFYSQMEKGVVPFLLFSLFLIVCDTHITQAQQTCTTLYDSNSISQNWQTDGRFFEVQQI
jgi:fumarate reductase subunit C